MKVRLNTFSKSAFPDISDSHIGKSIPVIYGKRSAIELYCVNENQSPDNSGIESVYKLPFGTTDIGTPYIQVDDVFKGVERSRADYDNGLLYVSGARASSGSTYKLKLVNPIGFVFSGHSYPGDVLKDMFSRFGNIEFTESNFDVTEWNAELSDARVLGDIGLYYDDDFDLWQEVYNVSVKSRHPFRVDYNNAGKITARLKDYDRTSSAVIPSCDIVDSGKITITTDRSGVRSSVICDYGYNNFDDAWLSVIDTTYEKEVKQNFRKIEEHEIQTYLSTSDDAGYRASEEAFRLSSVPMLATIEVFGNLSLRINDVVTIALMPDNLSASSRQYAGNRDCLIRSIAPDLVSRTNTISALIIPDRTPAVAQVSVLSDAFTTVEREQSSIELIKQDIRLLIQYSVDGVNWYPNATLDDVYMRVSNDSGLTWEAPIKIKGEKGDEGEPAENILTQYSADGSTWSETPDANTVYMRTSNDGGTTWTPAIRIKGEQGVPGLDGSGVLVTIEDPLTTTGEYDTGQKGIFNSYIYDWTSTGATTGYWTLVEKSPVSMKSVTRFFSFDENTDSEYGNLVCIDNTGNDNNGVAFGATVVSGFRGNAIRLLTRSSVAYI